MKTRIINLFGIGLVSALALTSCSDEFLEDKKSYDKVSGDLYNTYEGCELRIDDIYSWCLPTTNSKANWRYPSSGQKDDMSQSTEEYPGFSLFVDPETEITTMQGNAPDYFYGSFGNIQANTYGHIRLINDAIQGISASNGITDAEKDKLLGQAYFFRAWRYYCLVKMYGGVPIVTDLLDPSSSEGSVRNTTKECIEFICSDLDKAAKMLAASTMNGSGFTGNDYGRVTTGTALALKGRVLLLWASPLFNRKNDQTRWTNAYTQMKEELDSINQCGYGLFTSGNNVNGSTFAMMFNQVGRNPEAVFFTLYNNKVGDDIGQDSDWERYIRPSNLTGSGGLIPSAMLIDMFPMADGKRPASADTYTKLDPSSYNYEKEYPFMNRDPRFYRTFVFPGFRWAYSGSDDILLGEEPNTPVYNSGRDFELWNYGWYADETKINDEESGYEYGADNLLGNGKGVYVRKRSDDYDINNNPLYTWAKTDNGSCFARSAQPYIELRYAEVLLNLAEVACGAGDMAYAVSLLQQIRARAGYTAENNYGLQADLASDQAKCMSAIIYERQIELAYEGKRFDDMRRWMLFDGGAVKVDGAPNSWTLEGWGGNTCTWLGFKPLNGQRRENIEFRVADSFGIGGTTAADGDDPLKKAGVERCPAVDLRQDLAPQLETLKTWYKANLVRKDWKGDSWSSNKVKLYIKFLPKYYLMGIPRGAQSNMKSAAQTIGWDDYNNGGAPGTFDPLAE